MQANWVKETTTTTGTGTVTLAGAVSGFASFSGVFGGNRVVRYYIEDANGNREIGYGTFTNSGTTLSRDTVLETLVSGTYDASSPSAITLSAGTHNVGIVAGASAAAPSPMGVAENTRLFSAHFTGNLGGTNATLIADRQEACPFELREVFNLSKLGVYVATAAGGSTSAVGITQMVDGIPGTEYLASGTIDLTTTGTKTVNVTDVILHPGWYMTHIVSTGTPALLGTNNEQDFAYAPLPQINSTTRQFPAVKIHKDTVTGGTLDASPETVISVSNNVGVPGIFIDNT